MRRTLSLVYGLVSYALFLAVFLYAVGFLADAVVPKTVDRGGGGGPVWFALAVNLALLALFAVQHSVMARPGFKRWWTRFVPKPIERSTYVLASSLVLGLLFWQWRPLPVEVWSVEAAWGRVALWGLFALGWGLVLASTFLISHAHLFGLRQVYDHQRGRETQPPEFQVSSLYRHMRHPIMTGFLIAFWATPEMSVGHLVFAVAGTGYILVGVALEERDLVTSFGDAYRAYRRQVPPFLPRPWPGGRRAGGEAAAGEEGRS